MMSKQIAMHRELHLVAKESSAWLWRSSSAWQEKRQPDPGVELMLLSLLLTVGPNSNHPA